MFRIKRDRQLELFDQTPVVLIRLHIKTTFIITSLLADLLASVWLSSNKNQRESPRLKGGQGE